MIYLDNAATTRPDAEALLNAERYYKENFFNPSALYSGALDVKKRLTLVKDTILSAFPTSYEVVFVSCGSEADNMAIFSCAKRGNAVTTSGEHSAVFECFNQLKNRGVEPRFAKLNPDGSVDEEHLLSLVDDKTTFVSVVRVNNETGAVNDVDKLAEKIKAKNPSVIFHSDGVQAFGKIPGKISDKIDLYSISAHKIGGIKGIGALVKKKSLNINPIVFGGGQESGLRSGTENVFGIVDFGETAKKRLDSIDENYLKVKKINSAFKEVLDKKLVKIVSGENSSPYVLSLLAIGLRGEVLMRMMEEAGVIIGTGSACSSRSRHSRVLKNCGYKPNELDGAVRISFDVDTTEEEADEAAKKLNDCIKKLKGVIDRK